MLNNLTGLRFYTAMWVFIFHLSTEYIKEFNVIFSQKGYLGVDMFFILSGFILSYVYFNDLSSSPLTLKKYYNFIIKRFAKIFPLHILSFVLVLILLFVGKYLFHQSTLRIQLNTIWQNLLMVHAWGTTSELSWNFPSWSISAEWFAYLFLFFSMIFIYRLNKILFYCCGVVLPIIFLSYFLSVKDLSLDSFTYFSFPRIIPEFLIGIMLGFVRLKKNISKGFASFLLLAAITLFCLIFSFSFFIDSISILVFSGIIFSLSYSTYFDFIFSNRVLLYLGNISFSFYIFQFISLIIFEESFDKISAFIKGDMRIFVGFIFVLCINLVLAAAMYQYVEEPIRKKIVKKFIKV